jgi:UDP-N-acetylmuramate dehydrogenase
MQIHSDYSLQNLNTFHIDAKAKYFVEVNSLEEFKELQEHRIFKREKLLVLGGGSNVLFTKDVDGMVVKNSMLGKELLREDKTHFYVKANAGEVWHTFVLWCIQNNYAGVENLSLIPGQVGASPIQNIGAYGVELKDVCDSVEAIHLRTGEQIVLSNLDCEFGYRDSVFKHQLKDEYLITAVNYRLNKSPNFQVSYGDIKATLQDMNVQNLTLKNVSDAVVRIRSSKLPDPKVLGNAGSFFKNPTVTQEKYEELVATNPVMPSFPQKDGTVKIPAGWLIEQCGWKGKVVGNTGSHKSQALVLVNYGNATGAEIYQLALDIKKSVFDKFGVEVNPEVNLV